MKRLFIQVKNLQCFLCCKPVKIGAKQGKAKLTKAQLLKEYTTSLKEEDRLRDIIIRVAKERDDLKKPKLSKLFVRPYNPYLDNPFYNPYERVKVDESFDWLLKIKDDYNILENLN